MPKAKSVKVMGPQALDPQDPDRADVAAQFPAMLAELSDIINNGATYTAAQTRDAVVNEAKILRRVLRVLQYFVGLK